MNKILLASLITLFVLIIPIAIFALIILAPELFTILVILFAIYNLWLIIYKSL